MKVEFELSIRSINNAIGELQRYKKNLINAQDKIVKKLVSDGLSIAKEKATTVPEHAEIISKDIQGKVTANKGIIYTTTQDSTYAEYGIGIVGSTSPHPNSLGWQYDVNAHGTKGWWYPTDEAHLIKKTDKDGQGWAWTKGYASQRFLYDTALKLRTIAPKIVQEVIKGV